MSPNPNWGTFTYITKGSKVCLWKALLINFSSPNTTTVYLIYCETAIHKYSQEPYLSVACLESFGMYFKGPRALTRDLEQWWFPLVFLTIITMYCAGITIKGRNLLITHPWPLPPDWGCCLQLKVRSWKQRAHRSAPPPGHPRFLDP